MTRSALVLRGPCVDERGIALAMALFALVIIGGLVGSVFFGGHVEQQSGQNTVFAAQVREAADAGLSEATGSLTAEALRALPAGEVPVTLDTIRLGNGLSVSREITRLTSGLFLVRSEAVRHSAAGRVMASRSLGLLVRLAPSASAEDGPQWVERGWVQLY
jgi:hypothetical protein